jgi:hypothetical protein
MPPMEDVAWSSRAPQRFNMLQTVVLGRPALALAMTGL